MSNSKRVKEKRSNRAKMSKSQRSKMAEQHFGNRYVYQGRRLMKGQVKKSLMEADRGH